MERGVFMLRDGTGGAVSTGLTWAAVTGAFTSVGDIFTNTMSTITGNVVLMASLAAGVIVLGFRLFKRAKRSVK